VALAIVWIWHGLVPKLLLPETGELELLRGAGIARGFEANLLVLIGVGEIVFGVLLLVLQRSTKILWLMIAALIVLLVGAVVTNPMVLAGPFNPLTLTVAMVALAAVELVLARIELPSASRCGRAPLP
jgi:hypothetical protein